MCPSIGGHPVEGGRWGEERRIPRRFRRLVLVPALAGALVAAAPALADRPLPWAGGLAVVSDFERNAGQIASELSGRQVRVNCNGATDWKQLASQQRFDPNVVWGYVVFSYDAASTSYVPADYMNLSEQACWYLDQYAAAPTDQRGQSCKIATRIEFRSTWVAQRVVKRFKVRGVWRRQVTTVKLEKQVPVEIPEYGPCPDYMNRVFSIQALAHESMHLGGIADEAQAECQGMQRLTTVALRLGATPEQARQMASDYYTQFYMVKRPGTAYYLPGCPNPAG